MLVLDDTIANIAFIRYFYVSTILFSHYARGLYDCCRIRIAAVPMTLTAVHKVGNDRTGVASSLVNMAQQIGAGLGLAIFTTIAMTSATSKFPEAMSKVTKSFSHSHATGLDSDTAQALTHGYSTAFEYGSLFSF